MPWPSTDKHSPWLLTGTGFVILGLALLSLSGGQPPGSLILVGLGAVVLAIEVAGTLRSRVPQAEHFSAGEAERLNFEESGSLRVAAHDHVPRVTQFLSLVFLSGTVVWLLVLLRATSRVGSFSLWLVVSSLLSVQALSQWIRSRRTAISWKAGVLTLRSEGFGLCFQERSFAESDVLSLYIDRSESASRLRVSTSSGQYCVPVDARELLQQLRA